METIDLKDFFKYFKKFIIPTIIIAAIAIAATAFYETQFKTPLYRASTTVVLAQTNNDNKNTATLNDITVNQKLVSTYSEIAKSTLVLQNVIDDLKLNYTTDELSKRVTVTAIEDTEIIKISVEHPDRTQSATIADRIASVFIEEVSRIYQLNNVNILDVAKTPESPSNNTLKRDLALAAAISVFGVVAIAFLLFYFDDTVKYSEDLESEINLPIAGKIVRSGSKSKKNQKTEIFVEAYPKSAVSESIKTLRTNLQFSSVDHGFKTVLITSALAGEGKSFVSVNLAASFAQTNKKVLLVDCDLRKGRLHHILGVTNVLGFSNLLTDDVALFKKYIQKTHIKNLSVITRGAYPPNPSELLSSNKNKELLELLKEHYDIIIFDGTPCSGITDSVIMATLVDEVLIVTRDSKTPKATLDATRESLQKVKAPIAGVVMNAVTSKAANYYSYYGDKKGA
ncbi:polysaccharide biosynthesis tyrosine autokinase [Candidatus Saccharibacteria bacterium]|nr:polysaccharide biosynthesis tyrosine autokinase [Candidatus Saccharibacteria bacterium]